MKSTSKKKLVLSRDTVRALNSDQLASADGGRGDKTVFICVPTINYCVTDTCSSCWGTLC